MINRRAAGLIDENPLMVYRSLAKEIGLNEAIILQQVHFWSRDSANVRDGYSWVYNTYADWEKQFDFWSTATIRRSINRLEEAGLLISTSEYNKMKIDNTKWYRIDYEALENRLSRPPDQIEQTECSDCTDTPDQIEQANNQREPERTTKRTKEYIYFLEHTKLTQQEYDKLLALMGQDDLDDFLERFNVWITGQTAGVQKRRDAYLTINKWYKDEQKKKQNQFQKSGGYQTKSQRTSSVLDEAMKELMVNESGRRDITHEVYQHGLPEFRG